MTPSIIKAFNTAITRAKERGWDKIYVFADIHETIIKPNYDEFVIPEEFYEGAKEVMQFISNTKFFCLIMYTCSWPKENEKYLEYFKANGINFEYVNENPEVKSKAYGCYDHKPYINVLLEDKAGFDPTEDWKNLSDYFKSPEFLALNVK